MYRFPTPNYTKGRTNGIRWIIVHSTRSGIVGNDDWGATINWFANPASQASSHKLIGLDGRKGQFVNDEDTAWHAGWHNPYTLGIEFCHATVDTPFTEAELVSGAEEVRDWREKHRDLPVIGHDNTPQGAACGKSDPGPLFPWDRFMEMVTMSEQELAILKMQIALVKAVVEGRLQDASNILKYVGCK